MNVLLSIKPEFALRILAGSKKYEYRRAIFRRDDVKKVLLYATSPVRGIIGEFEVGTIVACKPSVLWERTREHAGIDKRRFFDYFAGANIGYAIKVKNSRKYLTPFCLKKHLGLSAPQSFLYLDWEPGQA